MDEPSADAYADELNELRKRAYGPDPDIQDDAGALARLIELEAARSRPIPSVRVLEAPTAEAAATAPILVTIPATQKSPPPRDTAPAPTRRWGLIALTVGAAIAATGTLAAVVMAWEPPPDAVLHPTGDEPDEQLLELLEGEGAPATASTPGASEMQIEPSTLRAFGTYREVEVWSATNTFGSPCVIGVHRATEDVVARRCMPAGADLFMDVYWDVAHGDDVRRALPEGQVLRFFLRAYAVDVHTLMSEGASR